MENEFEDFDELEDEEESLELAQEALDRGDNAAALELAEDYLEAHPFDVEALNLCAEWREPIRVNP